MSIFDVVPVSVDDYRRRAKRRLPQFLFDYVDGVASSISKLADVSAAVGDRAEVYLDGGVRS